MRLMKTHNKPSSADEIWGRLTQRGTECLTPCHALLVAALRTDPSSYQVFCPTHLFPLGWKLKQTVFMPSYK